MPLNENTNQDRSEERIEVTETEQSKTTFTSDIDTLNKVQNALGVYPRLSIGVSSADPSAALEVKSTSTGILFPRMTTAQRDLILIAKAGLVIFNTTTGVLNFYNGSAWGAV